MNPLGLEVFVSPPHVRSRGVFSVVIAHEWDGFQSLRCERASFRLRRVQDRMGPILMPLEKEALRLAARTGKWFKPGSGLNGTQRGGSWSAYLDAHDQHEAEFQQRMLVAQLQGLGFDVVH